MKRLALLDRDGVLNRERGDHTWRTEDFQLLPTAVDAIVALHDAGYIPVILTNQSGIGLGKYGHRDVRWTFDYIHDEVQRRGVATLQMYYCPHHPTKGRCLCRKPSGLMVERAIARNQADASSSFLVGDKERDLEAARSAGVEALLMPANGDLLAFLRSKGKI